MTGHAAGSGIGRRRMVRACGALAAGLSLTAAGTGAGRGAQDGEGTVTVEDQRSTGDSLVVAAVRTSVDAELHVFSDRKDESGQNVLYGRTTLTAGTDTTDLTVPLDAQPIRETRVIRVLLVPTGEGQRETIATDTAVVAVGEDPDRYGTELVAPDRAAGFEYPYFRYVPPSVGDGVPLLVQPNNTGRSTDDFAVHRRAARETIERGTPRRMADSLGVPLLVPVFPRPRSDPVDGSHYVHQLDRDTLAIEEGPLERVDLQLLAMVDHARAALAESDLSVRERVLLNGFSASGNFADRFTEAQGGSPRLQSWEEADGARFFLATCLVTPEHLLKFITESAALRYADGGHAYHPRQTGCAPRAA
ncbi:hypothetical protein [Haloglomus litoreum]|uniref:hypothetical protein n=1 Tax=Haloglomus litoreum TaxID=3034026 RepID=UPI0023E7EE1C|nr:hypothetical protein [Haloglomus sp. DT116]